MTDESLMPFGLHKDKPLAEVPASYFLWLLRQKWFPEWPDLHAYVVANEEGLTERAECEETTRSALREFQEGNDGGEGDGAGDWLPGLED